jgi:hypothetical protein
VAVEEVSLVAVAALAVAAATSAVEEDFAVAE